MIALIAISLVVIGIATIFYFKSQNEQYHLERLQRKEQSVMLSLDYFIIENRIDTITVRLENKIQELADIHALDLNVYTTGGELLGSTQIELFDNGTFSKNIPDSVLQRVRMNEQIIVNEESKGSNYLSTYFLLYNSGHRPIAIINLPYRKDVAKNEQELFDFLFTLAQVYILLFLGASILAYFLANYITDSLRTISEKLQTVRINKQNEKIDWKSRDEIGELVREYNRMVDELEDSARLLAKSERESAWKEMARQVAHEIKNPLTPMRLSVQHLQRALTEVPEEVQERMARFSKTMIEQIDSLSHIASEFSNFAKMPKATLEPLEIDQVIQHVVDLYHDSRVSIAFDTDGQTSWVLGDKEQWKRVFTNLVKNAIQAIPEETEGRVQIRQKRVDDTVHITVTDNGSGIPEVQREKVFEPNFTTKSSGMGLGLAIVKSIVESSKGTIRFESAEGQGTTFFIELPVHDI